MKNESTVIQQITDKAIKKGKKALYLVLKKKSFSQKVIEKLEKEIEIRMQKFLEEIYPKLIELKFEKPKESIKYIILKGLINILKKMINEHSIELSKEDANALDDIMKDDE